MTVNFEKIKLEPAILDLDGSTPEPAKRSSDSDVQYVCILSFPVLLN